MSYIIALIYDIVKTEIKWGEFMKFSVGYKILQSDNFINDIIRYKDHISEVYFSWGEFPNGRNNQSIMGDMTPWEAQQRQIDDIRRISREGIGLNLLFNANCYGADSQSKRFFEKIGDTVDYISNNFGLKSLTTTSPLIAKFIKDNFEEIDVRASVNMEIGTIEGMEYIAQYFDSFYMKRELNRDFDAIKRLCKWCRENGKKLHMLANSGCLNFCSAHNFHDNLVAHESEIAKMDNGYNFKGICKEFLSKEENYMALINNTNFVRPEDITKYYGYFESAKIATRVSRNPSMILESYVKGRYSGNILDILEPAHSIYPYIIENGEPLRLKKLETDVEFE